MNVNRIESPDWTLSLFWYSKSRKIIIHKFNIPFDNLNGNETERLNKKNIERKKSIELKWKKLETVARIKQNRLPHAIHWCESKCESRARTHTQLIISWAGFILYFIYFDHYYIEYAIFIQRRLAIGNKSV